MNRHLIAAAALCAASFAAQAAPVTYVLDPLHSYPNFTVDHLGMSTMYGRFDRMTGKIVLDVAAKTGTAEIKVAANSINTGDSRRADNQRSRDDHLRNADFFNASEFPEITYRSTKFNFNGDKVASIEGNLTLLGVTKPVRLNVTSFQCGPHPFNKKPMCGANAETSIKRSDFGMKYGLPAIGDDVKLIFSLEAFQE